MDPDALMMAQLPTFLKAQLVDAAAGKLTYAEVGWHLGYHNLELFDVDGEEVMKVSGQDIDKRPTATLRRLFANEKHPKGEFVDCIPAKHRRDFLRGLIEGARGEQDPEWWRP